MSERTHFYQNNRRRRLKLMRTALYALLLFLVTLIQVVALPGWVVGGVHPLWLPVLGLMVAVREGEYYGLIFGAVTGLLCDTILPPGGAFYTLALMAAGYLTGYFVSRYFRRGAAATLLWCTLCFAGMELLYFLILYLLPGRAGFSALLTTALPELVFSVLSGLLLYWPVRWISMIGEEKRETVWGL